jgi:hypothetical protein
MKFGHSLRNLTESAAMEMDAAETASVVGFLTSLALVGVDGV